MSSKVRSLFRFSLFLALAAGLLTTRANAASIVSVSYSGTITSAENVSQLGVAVGDRITGTFAYDSSQTGSPGNYNFTGSSKSHTLAFQIYPPTGPETSSTLIFSDRYTGNTSLQLGGYYAAKLSYNSTSSGGTQLNLMGDSAYKYPLGEDYYLTGTPAYNLTMTNPTNGGGYTATNLPLPTTTLMTNFVQTTGTLRWDPDGQFFSSDNLRFVIGGVPEPSGLVLAVLGASTVLVGHTIARRRRTRAAKG